ncbi:hypothetical protein, partial [Escherichia coli]|uniref:hypothetical protein n=1 Tax=Escherichia coli TaxID=562 RepID=UPI003EE301DA
LLRLGFTLTDVPDSHLCCGSAGTYALTHPDLARHLLAKNDFSFHFVIPFQGLVLQFQSSDAQRYDR